MIFTISVSEVEFQPGRFAAIVVCGDMEQAGTSGLVSHALSTESRRFKAVNEALVDLVYDIAKTQITGGDTPVRLY